MEEKPDISSTKELLEAILEGAPFEAKHLDETIARLANEDQYLDYKDGRITTEKSEKQLKEAILFHVTGFANAEGGVLIVGVSEDSPRKVTGAKAPGKSTLVEWASRILSGSLGGFSPPPQIFSIRHPEGEVLVIAAARAPQLVPYVESGELRYALRIGDSTRNVPGYLISDLVLGRRNHPILKLHDLSLDSEIDERRILLEPRLQIDNTSLVASLNTTVGAVAWYWSGSAGEPNEILQRYVDATTPTAYVGGPDEGNVWNLRHLVNRSTDATIRAYARHSDTIEKIRLPRQPDSGVVVFGLYIMPRESPPTWYEVECLYTVDRPERAPRVNVRPKFARSNRPRVKWWSR